MLLLSSQVGPKTPSPLAKSLKTYREDVYRTLLNLIDKDMVRPSLESPTLYSAVELDTALESALKKHESELREMERRKRELEALAQQQRFRPSDEVITFKVLKIIREIVGEISPVIVSTEKEFLWVAPKEGLLVASVWSQCHSKRTYRTGRVHAWHHRYHLYCDTARARSLGHRRGRAAL
ncbi:MAG: helix-turn-helix domain-containing protein [Halobacteriota archaeon]